MATSEEQCCDQAAQHEGKDFYVSVIDGSRVGFLAGPYATHTEALADVPTYREKACQANARAHWYAFGTLSLPAGTPRRTVFTRAA